MVFRATQLLFVDAPRRGVFVCVFVFGTSACLKLKLKHTAPNIEEHVVSVKERGGVEVVHYFEKTKNTCLCRPLTAHTTAPTAETTEDVWSGP